MVGPTIAKWMEQSGRGIKVSSSSLILSFNFVFSPLRPPMESSNASSIALWILEIREGRISLRSTSEWYFPFLFFTSLFSIINFLDYLSKTTLCTTNDSSSSNVSFSMISKDGFWWAVLLGWLMLENIFSMSTSSSISSREKLLISLSMW